MSAVTNAFSVDVEEHFQVLNFRRGIPQSSWDSRASRVEASTQRLLDLLAQHGIRATFFILGWVAQRHPGLVREIAAQGHEVASHGWSHTPVFELDEATFRSELDRSRKLLQDLSGGDVIGFRAPSFSLGKRTPWGFPALLEAGFRYDSSLFPVRHPDYGDARGELGIHAIELPCGRTLVEFPPAVARFLGARIPVAGGGWFRLLPLAVTRWGLRQINRSGRPAVFYVHPWEVDPEQPDLRHATSRSGALRHYLGLARTLGRLDHLLSALPFATCRDVLTHCGHL